VCEDFIVDFHKFVAHKFDLCISWNGWMSSKRNMAKIQS